MLIRWTVAADERVRITTRIAFPFMSNLWRNHHVVSDLKRRPVLAKDVSDFTSEHDCVLRIRMPVQLEARPRGKVGVVGFSASARVRSKDGALSSFRNS